MMADDNEFITRLIGFGLSEKEARLYLQLLKYGPKTPSLLAKSLKTYREDAHRTLTALIDKGIVNSSLESPTVYTAVDLDIALESTFKKHESELREMETRKQELKEMSKQQHFRQSDKPPTFRILKNIKEIIAVLLSTSVEKELLFIIPGEMCGFLSLYISVDESKKFTDWMERGGHVRGITDISYPIIEGVQMLLDNGARLRHYDNYRGIYFSVADRKHCLSAINTDARSYSLDEPVKTLWSDDPNYANHLVSTFELLWEQSVPAAQRIEELLKEGPLRV